MTTAELLQLAEVVERDTDVGTYSHDLARAIIDLLSAPFPCGYGAAWADNDADPPCVYDPSLGEITADDARGIAVGLMRAADAVKEKP